jgi:hypothetical protein
MLLLSSFVSPAMSFVDHVRIYCVKSQHYGQCFVDHSKALCVASMIIMEGEFLDLVAFYRFLLVLVHAHKGNLK